MMRSVHGANGQSYTPPDFPASAPAGILETLVGPDGWARLPPIVRKRFAPPMDAEFSGDGDFEANCAGRAFAVLGVLFGRPLPTLTGHATVFIRVKPTKSGERWTRLYAFEDREEHLQSVKHRGNGHWLEERAGPLIMRLAVFEHAGALVFECIGFLLRFGGRDLPLPFVCTPGRIRVEHHDLGQGRFIFTLEARHPWFGVTFKQVCHLCDAGADL